MKPQLSNSIWFFDIGDTIVDTASVNDNAAQAVYDVFSKHFSDLQSQQVRDKFTEYFSLMLAGQRVQTMYDWDIVIGGKTAYSMLLDKIHNCQKDIINEFGHAKKWSREVFIKLAADQLYLAVTPQIIEDAADSYWVRLTEYDQIFEGTKKVFHQLKQLGRPVYIFAGSDARLKMKPNGQFIYDPEHSRQLKLKRVAVLKEKGISYRQAFIGDPIDKPDQLFFEKMLEMAETDLHESIDPANCIIVGDSFQQDIEIPLTKLNIGLGVLFQKGQKHNRAERDNYLSTGDLTSVLEHLSNS